MLTTIQYNSRKLQIDLSKPLDISIPLRASTDNVNAWYIDEPKITPVKTEEGIIAVSEGASVNFNTIEFNPHAHGTHTECLGHITPKLCSVNQQLNQFFFLAEVISVAPETFNEDKIISQKQLQFALGNKKREALVIRTLPNTDDKLTRQYSDTNWPYLKDEAMSYLVKKGINHLLIDLPSVDRERDDGELKGHHIFWNMNGRKRYGSTITEFIYVPNHVEDGTYFIDLHVAPFENDAAPSRPVLYRVLN